MSSWSTIARNIELNISIYRCIVLDHDNTININIVLNSKAESRPSWNTTTRNIGLNIDWKLQNNID